VPLTLKIKISCQDVFFQQKETPKDLEIGQQAHKHSLNPNKLNFQVKIFSFNEKEISDSPEKKRTSTWIVPLTRRENFQKNDQDFQV